MTTSSQNEIVLRWWLITMVVRRPALDLRAIGDVFQNGPIHQFAILAGKGNLAPPLRGIDSVQRYPVNENMSLIGLNKPTQKIDDRRFPGT
ncbi:hypothetical protein ASE23_28005 [Rhizobium sp. Root73]|nr:hypothetical protein ASD36_27955 [Rhizobium sp. Root1334]KRC04489.1 hypothetical protein ASE23_28005 [Rhizobium sp. Root73]